MDEFYERLFISNIYIVIYAYIVLLFTFNFVVRRCNNRLSLIASYLLILILAFMFANRNIDIASDTLNYKETYDQLNLSYLLEIGDVAFYGLMYLIKLMADFKVFLFVVALTYMGAAFVSFRRFFGDNAYIAFLIFLISPYFVQFGDNVIRNGMAASIFLLALSYTDKKKKYSIMVLSCLVHSSMLLSCLFYYVSNHFNSLRKYIDVWIIFLLLAVIGIDLTSLILFFLAFSNSLGTGAPDVANYQDFLIYGLPIVLGGLLIYKKTNIKEKCIYRIYILGSCLQLMSLSYSVMALRFAYFAGMFMPLVLTTIFNHTIKRRWVIYIIITIVFSIKSYKILTA